MNAERLLEHYERVADAPDAISRLRRLVLDLAVRGKLVPQDASDEPASELVKRIRAAREQTNRNERTKRPRPNVGVKSVEVGALPSGWVFVSLADLVTVLNGRAYKQSELLTRGTPVLRVGNLFTSNKWYYSDLRLEDDKYCDRGDLIFAWSASFGPFIWTGERVIYHYHIWKLPLHSEDDLDKFYLHKFLLQKTREIKESGHGISMIHMTKEKMERIEVPLPPLAEQQRIVAKVDELMTLCDQLEAARATSEATRDRLASASLARLNIPDPETFRDDARFALDALPALTTRPDQIKQLRETILSLAVLGKLTGSWRREHPDTRDASEIVARLENAHETAGGHRQGNAAAATEGVHDLKMQDLPAGWQITDLRTAVYPDRPVTYGILMPGPDTPGGVPYVRVADFPDDRLNLGTIRRTTHEIERKYARARLRAGDILLSIRGTVGRICVAPVELNGANITQDTARLSIQPALNVGFVVWFLRSTHAQRRMQSCSKGVAVRGINIGDVRAVQLPVPPLAEQSCIVTKVDELMGLCDRLEASLVTREDTRRRLLYALLHEALEPVEVLEEAA